MTSELPIIDQAVLDELRDSVGGDQAFVADLASTYRNLETLETIGIVRHVHLGHGPGRYELSDRSAGWATCEACGRSTPLPSPALQAIRLAVREAAGFEATFRHFPIVGRCSDCTGP